ncbi:Holliday junction resolvase RuvX [Paraburkholderia ferrariae]|jgi:putative Holliday junction resolvase|uniref:Holliday junction resolvase RuvX n=1 Tax=Paraburkholderia ferrariae TaxID=386056 RepID=UPI000487F9EA|nr:Holliday junction resolvase RuvX [Paraburkholderia ferrariae]
MSVAAGRGAAEATLLAFDYGEKRIGVALGNVLTHSARSLTVIQNRSRDYRFEAIGALVREWQPDLLVVGLPCHPDGTPHAMTQHAKRFGNQLNGRFNLPVVWVDERYSSVDAEARLRERGEFRVEYGGKHASGQIDAEAACVILQQYLDERSASPS